MHTLRPLLDRVRRDLGVTDGSRLKAELHNMLVYGPGQFFAGHRDSEKTDDMIGTLVVVLPSDFTGGAIEVEHDDERVTSSSSRTRRARSWPVTIARPCGDTSPAWARSRRA